MVKIKLHTSMIDMNVKYMYGAIQQIKFERAHLDILTNNCQWPEKKLIDRFISSNKNHAAWRSDKLISNVAKDLQEQLKK